jgi:hypothetical protein
MKNNEKKVLRNILIELSTFENQLGEIKDEVDYRYNEQEEKSPNSERLEKLQIESEKLDEVVELLNSFNDELTELLEGE